VIGCSPNRTRKVRFGVAGESSPGPTEPAAFMQPSENRLRKREKISKFADAAF